MASATISERWLPVKASGTSPNRSCSASSRDPPRYSLAILVDVASLKSLRPRRVVERLRGDFPRRPPLLELHDDEPAVSVDAQQVDPASVSGANFPPDDQQIGIQHGNVLLQPVVQPLLQANVAFRHALERLVVHNRPKADLLSHRRLLPSSALTCSVAGSATATSRPPTWRRVSRGMPPSLPRLPRCGTCVRSTRRFPRSPPRWRAAARAAPASCTPPPRSVRRG